MKKMKMGAGRQALALLGASALLTLLSLSWVSAQVSVPLAGVVPSSGTRVEENDPSVVYTGVWLPQHRSNLSGVSIVESPYPVSTASLTFVGTGIRWIGYRAAWGGIAQVYIDGAENATVDTYAPTEQAQAVIYTATGLAAGAHTITIKVTGTWSPAGCCSWVVVDAFDVMKAAAGESRICQRVAVRRPTVGLHFTCADAGPGMASWT